MHPDDAPRFEAALKDHLEGRTAGYECEYRSPPPGRRLALAGGARPAACATLGQAVEIRRLRHGCDRAEAGADRQGTAGSATEAVAEDGGDRHAGGRHRPRLQQHPRRDSRLRRARATAVAENSACAPLPRQRHACDRAREDAGRAHSRIQPQRARRPRAGERPVRHHGDARAARGVAARGYTCWKARSPPATRR